jgi:hypothetical protein
MWQVINRSSRTMISTLILGRLAIASSPIASVRTADTFQLDGHSINTPGVTLWPLVLGDEFTSSQNSPVIILFRDGSRVKLDAGSRARIAGSEEQPKVVLLSGTLDFKLVPKSNLTVTNLESERKKAASLAKNNRPLVPAKVGEAVSEGSNIASAVAAADSLPVLFGSQFLLPPTIATSAGVRAAALVMEPPVSPHL